MPLAIDRFGRAYRFDQVVGALQLPLTPPYLALGELLWWVAWCLVGFLIVPVWFLRCQGRHPREFGLRTVSWRSVRIYPILYLCMVPLIYQASLGTAFRATYPFYRHWAERPDLLVLWWLAYASMFVALEFFFRGFLVHSLRERFAAPLAVLLAALPYFVIHYTKPWPEMLGSFPAGLVLGALALETGSILGGAGLHLAVAFTMDALVVVR